MKSQLEDGTVIELIKDDCGCLDSIHTGPHWLHMDAFDRATNQLLLNHKTPLNLHAFA